MNETEKPKKKSPKRIIDVHKPGASAPDATSKPVIVNNRPLLHDPMVVADDKKAASEEDVSTLDETVVATGSKPVIEPLAESPESDSESKESLDNKNPSTDEEPPVDQSVGETSGEESTAAADANSNEARAAATDTPEPQSIQSNTSDQPVDDTPSPNTPKDAMAKQEEAEAAAVVKHDADVQQLIDSKRYTLPITTVEQRKSKRFVVLGIILALVLIIIWLDIALDAGIIKLGGLKSLTHFFSN